MQTVKALIGLGFGLSYGYGWACWFLPRLRRDWLTLTLTTFGLSLGGLTLWMFWVALIGPGRLGAIPILGGCAVLGIAGLWFGRKDLRPATLPGATLRAIWKNGPVEVALAAIILAGCAGILFNSVYWPFFDGDALEVYAPLAKGIYQTGILPTGIHLYEGYPALVPMAYAFTHWMVGGVNEYLARLVPALMAVGAVAAAGALGRELRSRRTGMLAAAVVVLAPFFCKWASSGYVDIPASFYFCLSALFAWRWWRGGGVRSAALAGMMAGLAMWTKNNALTLLVSLGLLIALRWWMSRRRPADSENPPFQWNEIFWLAGAIAATALPWYLRNVLVFHFIIPPTIWAQAVPHSLGTLFVFASAWKDFGITGLLIGASILYGAVQSIRKGNIRQRVGWWILLAAVVPFYAAWWGLAGYDVRFLLMILPPLAVMAGLMLDDLAVFLQARLSPIRIVPARWLAALCFLAISPFSLLRTVEYKVAVLSHPFMSDLEKHRIRFGWLYDLALAVNALPPGSRIAGVPPAARYYIEETRFEAVSSETVNLPPTALKGTYDYAAYQFPEGNLPDWVKTGQPLMQTADGYYLFAVYN